MTSRFALANGSAVTRLVLLISLALSLACQSGPVIAFEGSRHYSRGTDALAKGDASTAIAELERAAELIPHASEVRNHLGVAYWASGRSDDAARAFEEAITLDCDNQAARINLARLQDARPENETQVKALPTTAAPGPGLRLEEREHVR